MSIHGRPIGENYHVPARHTTNHHVAIPGANQNAAGEEQIAGTRFVNFESAAFVEALGEHFGKTFGHVLHNQNRGLKIRGDLRQDKLQSVWAAGGNTDGDDAARRQSGTGTFFRRGDFFDDGGRKFAADGALGDFYFSNHLIGDVVEAAGGVFWFREKIDGAHGEGFEGSVTALFRMSAEKDDRQRGAPHDEAQRLHAVHARHLEVEGHDIGLELFNFFQCKSAVHGGADNFDGRFARKNRRDQFPHEGGIVDDENPDALAHAIAPSGVARARRERTAGTFRMRTTVPSPRIDAPLTKSLETISAGSAFMTSSSSPTRLSTRRPKRFSAAPMTTTKCFFFTGCVSMLRRRLSSLKRTRVRI